MNGEDNKAFIRQKERQTGTRKRKKEMKKGDSKKDQKKKGTQILVGTAKAIWDTFEDIATSLSNNANLFTQIWQHL